MAKRIASSPSSSARTTYSHRHPVGNDYDGLRRAAEAAHELLPRHEVRLANFHPLSGDGTLFRLHVKGGLLETLTPPITEGWLVQPSPGSPRARIMMIDEDDDKLIVRCGVPSPNARFSQNVWISAPDFQLRLRQWLETCSGRKFPSLLERLREMKPMELSREQLGLPEEALAGLRAAQLSAVASTGHGQVYLWGPPGTGKTHTLARAVQSLIARGFKVAVLAPTNVAVDTAVLAIHKAYQAIQQPLQGGFLVRAGYTTPELDPYPELLAWQHSLLAQQRELKIISNQARDVARALLTAEGTEKLRLTQEKAELKRQEEDCKRERGDELWRLSMEARIMATTVYSAMDRSEMLAFLSAPKVALIIDEAGMVARYSTLPFLELLGGGEGLQGSLATVPEQVALVLAGDPRQLGPIHRQRDESDVNLRHWMGQSLMEELLEPATSTINTPFLNEQLRMDDSICERISRTYYDGRLSTVPDSNRPRPPLVKRWPEDGVVMLDPRTAPLADQAPPESFLDKGVKWNERNQWVGVRLIDQALRSGSVSSVLWLTPFRDQARYLRKMRDAYFSEFDVRTGTVHTSQGGEADLVVFDPVSVTHRWLRGEMGTELEIERMLNVAISRARGQAIVLVNPLQANKNPIFWRLLHDAARWNVS